MSPRSLQRDGTRRRRHPLRRQLNHRPPRPPRRQNHLIRRSQTTPGLQSSSERPPCPAMACCPGNLRFVFRRRTGVRVRQRIRKFELWPVFKLALVFHAICGAISLGVLTLVWKIGENAGFTDRVINFLVDIGFAESVRISGASLFRGACTIAVGLVLHNTVVTVLLAALYNLLSGLLGGLIMSVVEDDQIRRTGRRGRKAPVQRAKAKRSTEREKPPQELVGATPPPRSSSERRFRRKRTVNPAVSDIPPSPPPAPSPGQAASRTSSFTESPDELDDADWLAALADDSFDDDFDLTVEDRLRGELK